MTTTIDVRLKTRYRNEIAGALKTQFGYKNPMQIPTLVKIVVNMGVGEAARDSLDRRRSPRSTNHYWPKATSNQVTQINRAI